MHACVQPAIIHTSPSKPVDGGDGWIGGGGGNGSGWVDKWWVENDGDGWVVIGGGWKVMGVDGW